MADVAADEVVWWDFFDHREKFERTLCERDQEGELPCELPNALKLPSPWKLLRILTPSVWRASAAVEG
jgi:hypothetical protein